jgi:hypothetical protein
MKTNENRKATEMRHELQIPPHARGRGLGVFHTEDELLNQLPRNCVLRVQRKVVQGCDSNSGPQASESSSQLAPQQNEKCCTSYLESQEVSFLLFTICTLQLPTTNYLLSLSDSICIRRSTFKVF